MDGVLYIAPSLNWEHQGIALEISTCLRECVQITGQGKVRAAPMDVELSYKNVFQPDMFVLLNEHLDRVVGTRVIGAPDLVVEIASPGTACHDLSEKLWAYAHTGVPEYW